MNKDLMIEIEFELNSIRYTLENIQSQGVPHKKTYKIIFNTLLKRSKKLQDMIIKHHKDLLNVNY
jgi:hypothetical protein